MKKSFAILCLCVFVLSGIMGCAGTDRSDAALPAGESEEPVTLTVSGAWKQSPAMEMVAQKFNERYPNCTVVYEYLQNYGETCEIRLQSESDKLDLFVTNNLQEGSSLLPYALDLFSVGDQLDLSNVHEGLIKNFTYLDSDKTAAPQIYAVPMGAELRGMFVNKTLLATLNLDVPTTLDELLYDCKVLSENGYIPIQNSPSAAGQLLMYPYICNLIANGEDYQSLYNRVNNCDAGVSELFRQPMETLYTLVENNYYNYKYVLDTTGAFEHVSDEEVSEYFLNIYPLSEDTEPVKLDDVGTIAFMPAAMTVDTTLAKTKDDYHSLIDYTFILTPVTNEGGFAYMSPATGIAVNKDGDHVEWALKFLDFFFSPEINKLFADERNTIPCTKDALSYITEKFQLPESRVCQLGDVSFDYKFYALVNTTLTAICKANNPKYMQDDGNGNYTMYDFSYYMDAFEALFAEQRLANQTAVQ